MPLTHLQNTKTPFFTSGTLQHYTEADWAAQICVAISDNVENEVWIEFSEDGEQVEKLGVATTEEIVELWETALKHVGSRGYITREIPEVTPDLIEQKAVEFLS